jgi:hypothetical protein
MTKSFLKKKFLSLSFHPMLLLFVRIDVLVSMQVCAEFYLLEEIDCD